ncbi:MAG: ADOP family duplicated permease [Gemmatimonadaceae bacterium]
MDALGTRAIQLIRRLGRAPGYSIATILVLGCGIGVGVAALAIAKQALLAPLPYAKPDRLVVLTEATTSGGQRLASQPTVRDWAAQATQFEAFSYVTGTQLLLRQPSGPLQLVVAYPTGPFFELMQGRPLLGRTFADGEAPNEPEVVLAYSTWQSAFGGRADIVGQRIPLGDGGATVIGIMPSGFAFPEWAQGWLPARAAPAGVQRSLQQRANHADSRTIGRLAPSASLTQAASQLNAIAARLSQAYPDDSRDWTRVDLTPMREYVLAFTMGGAGQDLTPRIALFVGAAVLILLLGCANVAVLGLVRNVGRSRELAVRAALGASRRQVFQYVLTESLMLAVLGGAAGLLLGWGLVRAVQIGNPELFPRLSEVRFDSMFVGLGMVLSVLTGLLAGVVPSVRATPGATIPVMGGTRGQVGEGRASGRLQRVLIASQVALAVMLLAGAGVLLRSMREVVQTPVGFDPAGLSVVRINPPDRYDTPERLRLLYEALMGQLRQLPGVQAVAFTNHAPLSGTSMPTRVVVAGREANEQTPDQANFKTISPNYFTTVGVAVLRGRVFTDADLGGPNGTVVINDRLAKRLWPGADPIGRTLTIFKSARWLPDFGSPLQGTVIGVVANVRHFGQETDPPDEVYVPFTWNVWNWGTLVVRTAPNAALTDVQVRRVLLTVEPDLPVGGPDAYTSFGDRLRALRAARLLLTSGLALLALAALAITMIGLYATLAFAVRTRRPEIGIRFALGARRTDVMREVFGDGLRTTGIGLAAGVALAWMAASLLQSLVVGVSPRDPLTLALALIPLLLVALLAIYLPARSAASVPPAEALRS